jgi:hypothetical protein
VGRWERITEFYVRPTSKDRHPLDSFTQGKSRTKISRRNIHKFNQCKMVPVAKRTHNMALQLNEQGQISIFFSASLVVMITIVAFVINIGLFVKAKINLQNATDAAAYAGASVQARQLTKIAYLNWEMRNIYKEWMYKYYVIGNLNIPDVENPDASSSSDMKFKLMPDNNVLTGVVTPDKFNIPAVCIHISGSQTNICKRYSVPGLPEFGSSNLAGAEEASRAFMDTLISTKVNDCVDRSRLNMTVANTWTYNVLSSSMDDSMAGNGPAILSDRQGAWPRAVELALRIRNLEYVMNREAVSNVCAGGSTSLTNCSTAISSMDPKILGNERIVKAFYSGFRNLGNDIDNEMKNSFTLTELPPKKIKYDNPADASNLLIPSGKLGSYERQWLDLKLMMVNYAIFYAAMIPRADDRSSGACDISKVAIPVPGYPLGFYKNPSVLTYYAVKGEAEFVGMFNPFQEGAVKLQAFAAAKPMGGRIGPMLFTQKNGENYITGRTDSLKYRSVPYLTSYTFDGVTIRNKTYSESGNGSKFIPGLPLPTNSADSPGSFWLDSPGNPVGGTIADAARIQFGVPNLVYDYEQNFRPTGYTEASLQVHMIDATNSSSEKAIGLFSKNQFKRFKGSGLSSTISPEQLRHEINRIRTPTLYEAANYMIPTPNTEVNLANALDSFGFISQAGSEQPTERDGITTINANIYAPLYSQNQVDILFQRNTEVVSTISDYMLTQEQGMRKYLMAMNKAALNIWLEKDNVAAEAAGSKQGYESAARGVSDINFSGASTNINDRPNTCNSLAGQFLYFYFGGLIPALSPVDPTGCPKPLNELLGEYYSGGGPNGATDDFSADYYSFSYSFDKNVDNLKFMSAYMPGPYKGAGPEGMLSNPITGASDNTRRNFYSTKFITLDSVQSGKIESYGTEGSLIHSEGSMDKTGTGENVQHEFKNPLEGELSELDPIRY